MGILSMLESTLGLLNRIEIKGESNIALMASVIANTKGMIDVFKTSEKEINGDDSNNQQG